MALALAPSWREAGADGGVVRLRQTVGPFAVTLFSPEPLCVGAADLGVLVQDGPSGEAVLDAQVEYWLTPPGTDTPRRVVATRDAATNKLMQAALVDLSVAGTWALQVEIRRGAVGARAAGELHVEPPPAPLAALSRALALPPLLVGLFAVGQWLAHRRRQPAQSPRG